MVKIYPKGGFIEIDLNNDIYEFQQNLDNYVYQLDNIIENGIKLKPILFTNLSGTLGGCDCYGTYDYDNSSFTIGPYYIDSNGVHNLIDLYSHNKKYLYEISYKIEKNGVEYFVDINNIHSSININTISVSVNDVKSLLNNYPDIWEFNVIVRQQSTQGPISNIYPANIHKGSQNYTLLFFNNENTKISGDLFTNFTYKSLSIRKKEI